MSASDGAVEISADAAWVAAALVLVASLGGAVVLAEWPLSGVQSPESDDPRLVEPGDGGTQLWPYTAESLHRSARTLGINMVFYGDPEDVRIALTQRSALEWEEEQVHAGDADEETISHERVRFNASAENMSQRLSLSEAEGSTRYTYVVVDGHGRWVAESYQLHSGTYFGSRMHIRAYEDPSGEWTAVQVHDEYWDWFRLRHTVTGVSDAQHEIEQDFMDERYVEDVVRMPFRNPTADSDGWTTGVHLAGLFVPLLVVGITIDVGRARREAALFVDHHREGIALGLALFALLTVIRHLGVAAETVFPDLNPRFITAPLYLALVVATPALAYLYGRDSQKTWAFAFATLGLGLAFVVDFATVGVSVLPLRVVLHRLGVVLAIGLVAVGATMTSDAEPYPPPLLIGLAGWAVALFAPLFGYL